MTCFQFLDTQTYASQLHSVLKMMSSYARNPIVKNYLYKLEQRNHGINTCPWYHINTGLLSPDLQDKFIPSVFDAGTESFLENCYTKSDWVFTQMFHNALRFFFGFFMSMTTVNGLLNRGSMFVCSHEQYKLLLGLTNDTKRSSWLDLGAGDGKVTECLLPHFDSCYATEQSPTMRWRLEEKGFQLLDIDKWQNKQYDVITALNLLDRIDQPLDLLTDLKNSMHADSILLLALVLPYQPCYERGASFGPPAQRLPLNGTSIEEQIESMVKDVLEPQGFEVVNFTRVPYLCEGDLHNDFFVLTDILFVLKLASGCSLKDPTVTF